MFVEPAAGGRLCGLWCDVSRRSNVAGLLLNRFEGADRLWGTR